MFRNKIEALTRHKQLLFQLAALCALLVISLAYLMPAAETVFLVQNDAAKKKLPIYCVDTPEKKVAISFDAAWGADDTQTLLDILAKNEVRTTFFLCGYWIDKYPEQVKTIHAAGHDIGNHGNTHAHGAKLSLEDNKKEIMAVHEKIYNLLGTEMNLFRPPFGEYNNTVLEAASSLGYHTIQWDVEALVTVLHTEYL